MDSFLKFFKKQHRNFAELSAAVYNGADPEAVHKLRVCLRRQRACLWILRHSSFKLTDKKLNGDLRKLGRKLGKVRELDVVIADSNKYGLNAHSLLKRRKAAYSSVRPLLTARLRKKRQASIGAVLKCLEGDGALDTGAAMMLLKKRIDVWSHRRIRDENEIHELRITLKKVRYVLEALGRPVGPLRQIQDVLGRVHDLDVLKDYLGTNQRMKRDHQTNSKRAIGLSGFALRFARKQLF